MFLLGLSSTAFPGVFCVYRYFSQVSLIFFLSFYSGIFLDRLTVFLCNFCMFCTRCVKINRCYVAQGFHLSDNVSDDMYDSTYKNTLLLLLLQSLR